MSGLAAVAAVAAPIIGGAIGEERSKHDRKRQDDQLREAARVIMGAMPPNPEDQKLYFENLRQQGILTPELEQAVVLERTAYDDIKADPRLREARMSALQRLQEVGNEGYTVEDKAVLNQIQSENAAIERGQREAILANQRARGMGGSGSELAAQLAAQQGAASRNAQQGLDVAAEARRRSLSALMESGKLAGTMEQDDFSRDAETARARDAIAEFNARNRQGVAERNTDRRNTAAEKNLDERQRIADANIDLRNKQQVHNKVTVYDNAYDRDFEKRQALSGQMKGLSDFYGDRAAREEKKWAKIGEGIGQGASTFAKK